MKIFSTVLAVLVVCTASMAQERSEKEFPRSEKDFPRCFLDAFNFKDTFYSRGGSVGGSLGAGVSPDSEVIWTGGNEAYGGRFFGAYEHTPCLAVEAAIGGYRRATRSNARPETMISLQVGLVAKLYLGDRFSIFARGGAHRWSLDSSNLEIENRERVVFIENDGFDPFYGVGAEITTNSGFWRFGISGTRYENSYRASIFRYNDATRAYNPGVLENGSHTDVIELSITRMFGVKKAEGLDHPGRDQ